MSDIIDILINGITFTFTWLASIEILGTNLLVILVTLTIIQLVVPVLINLPKKKREGRGND